MTKEMLIKEVKSHAQHLETIVEKDVMYCAGCEKAYVVTGIDSNLCPECLHELEPYSLTDYLQKDTVYDMNYTINIHGEYMAAALFVALGGPVIWIDTAESTVKGAWGADKAFASISEETRYAINEVCAAMYDELKGAER